MSYYSYPNWSGVVLLPFKKYLKKNIWSRKQKLSLNHDFCIWITCATFGADANPKKVKKVTKKEKNKKKDNKYLATDRITTKKLKLILTVKK